MGSVRLTKVVRRARGSGMKEESRWRHALSDVRRHRRDIDKAKPNIRLSPNSTCTIRCRSVVVFLRLDNKSAANRTTGGWISICYGLVVVL